MDAFTFTFCRVVRIIFSSLYKLLYRKYCVTRRTVLFIAHLSTKKFGLLNAFATINFPKLKGRVLGQLCVCTNKFIMNNSSDIQTEIGIVSTFDFYIHIIDGLNDSGLFP
jgi:hypothetical protein